MVAEKEDVEDESLRIDCPVLVTERLVLRPPHEDDVAELAELANNRIQLPDTEVAVAPEATTKVNLPTWAR